MDTTTYDENTRPIFDAIDSINSIADPLEKAAAATRMMYAIMGISEELRDIRQESVRQLKDIKGWGYQQIGDELGIGKARASQIYVGARVAKRPGVIEMRAKVAAAEMRAKGSKDEEIIAAVVPLIRNTKGGDQLSVKRIAEILEIDLDLVEKNMPPAEKTVAAG